MSKTLIGTSSTATKTLWEEKIWREAMKQSYFNKFSGKDGKSIVYIKDDLTKQKGDKIYFGLRVRLNKGYLPSGTPVEGNEESITTYQDSVTVDEKNFGIRDGGMIIRQRAFYDLDAESQAALVDQQQENYDADLFTRLKATNTSVLYSTNGTFSRTATLATATGTITTNDILTPDLITKIKVWSLTNRTSQLPIKPIMVDGRDYLVLLVHPDNLADLEMNSAFLQARREAEVRGKDNPIFTGAYAIWNGVVIHAHENITTSTTGGTGSNVPYSQCFVLGERALVVGFAKYPTIVEDIFSYGQEHGYASLSLFGSKKPQFNSIDYGSNVVVVARTQVSDK